MLVSPFGPSAHFLCIPIFRPQTSPDSLGPLGSTGKGMFSAREQGVCAQRPQPSGSGGAHPWDMPWGAGQEAQSRTVI